ncbi:hypothetical protein BN874_2300006 [Candidatus Contendobacter odensis Run_B_J11]|uniref:Uncharacterized protein n=1 Tax=Candidatus Contendobacter odensis Run_B_J11 TaxID=1400861 RepID=A0A7U7GC15_9GAMM|nr:hypothetical protein BN874_2300006 [Candidatus Contendobacter odensis Run_B_J11]
MVIVRKVGRDFLVQRGLGKPNDREQHGGYPTRRPIEGATLGISVNQQNFSTVAGQRRCHMHGQGRFTDAAFLIQKRQYHPSVFPFLRLYG